MLPVPTTNPAPVREDARTCYPLYQHTAQHQEENAIAEETSEPDAKQPARIPWPQQARLPDDIIN